MEKRFFLALAVSMLILITWSSFFNKSQPVENKYVIKKESAQTSAPVPVIEESSKDTFLNFHNEIFDVTFNETKAAIDSVKFKAYGNYSFPLKHGFLLGDNALIFKREESGPNIVSFVCADHEKIISKRYIFSNSNYDIMLEIRIKNLANQVLVFDFPLFLGSVDFSGNQEPTGMKELTISTAEKLLHNNARKEEVFGAVKFLALRDRYFSAILEPTTGVDYQGFVKKVKPQLSEVGLNTKFTITANKEIEDRFHIYLGPQDLRIINFIKPEWSAIINYGTFDFISHFLLRVLEFLNGIVKSWGWAIIILSVSIYFLFYPLTLKQMRSMKEMQLLQPQIEELRKNYRDNPQRLNKETMELYRKHKVNPLSGCLPLLLQMPIFFALYQTLMRSIGLKGASFLWIKDLSLPDRLIILPASLPLLGNEINILPIVMTIGMFVQQKISMAAPTSGVSSEQQKIMLIIMPLMFGFIFYHMPAGLVLYWFVNSALTLVYQFKISRKQPRC